MNSGFSEEEVRAFKECFNGQSSWQSWCHRRADDGRDVLEVITKNDDDAAPVRLTKVDRPRSYMAAGLKGWSLVICSSFDELIATVTGHTAQLHH